MQKLNTNQTKYRQLRKQQNKTTLVQSPLTTLGQETRWAYSTMITHMGPETHMGDRSIISSSWLFLRVAFPVAVSDPPRPAHICLDCSVIRRHDIFVWMDLRLKDVGWKIFGNSFQPFRKFPESFWPIFFTSAPWVKKQDTKLLFISSPNTDRFLKFFHCYTQQELFNKKIITDPTTKKLSLHYLAKY